MIKRPEDVLGTHFFSPANVMRLLEIVRGEKTSKSVLATITQLAPKIGKVPVVVGVAHGFVGNRMLAQRQREAQKLILEGATPSDVDRVLVDFGLRIEPVRDERSRRPRHRLVNGDVEARVDPRHPMRGGPARKTTGEGFYDYDEARNANPSANVEEIIRDFAKSKEIEQRKIIDAEILERCIYPMINEEQKSSKREKRRAPPTSTLARSTATAAGLPRRPDVLRRHHRIKDDSNEAQGISSQVRRRFQARGAIGEAGGGGRDVYKVVTQTALIRPFGPPSPRGRRGALHVAFPP